MTAKQRKILRESLMGYDPFEVSEDFANYAAVKDEQPPDDIENNKGDKDRDEEERELGESLVPKIAKRETRKPFWLKEQGPISGLSLSKEEETPEGVAPRTNIEKGKYKIL